MTTTLQSRAPGGIKKLAKAFPDSFVADVAGKTLEQAGKQMSRRAAKDLAKTFLRRIAAEALEKGTKVLGPILTVFDVIRFINWASGGNDEDFYNNPRDVPPGVPYYDFWEGGHFINDVLGGSRHQVM